MTTDRNGKEVDSVLYSAWGVTPEQATAEAVFHAARGDAKGPCYGSSQWDDILPGETRLGPNTPALVQARRERLELAEEGCLSCPLFAACTQYRESNPDLRGMLAGVLVTDYPIDMEQEKAA